MTIHTTMGSPTPHTLMAGSEMTVTELDRAGLLHAEPDTRFSRFAVFVPADHLGTLRPIAVGRGAVISAFAVLHGGVRLADGARVEERTVIGKPSSPTAVDVRDCPGRVRCTSGPRHAAVSEKRTTGLDRARGRSSRDAISDAIGVGRYFSRLLRPGQDWL
ncbi:hypothetical protein OG225_41700 (plasmid) [Nocardia sp. NBC_01377]|uniref:hypothetical protein n=1 Tax=Nocardia sp. NBC_01377 TaxID=2903595 RepID=UPI002F90BF0A